MPYFDFTLVFLALRNGCNVGYLLFQLPCFMNFFAFPFSFLSTSLYVQCMMLSNQRVPSLPAASNLPAHIVETNPFPIPSPLSRPQFQPPQSEGASRGLVPHQETGVETFCCPSPPPSNRNRAGLKAGPAHSPLPPSVPLHPHCRLTHGDRGSSPREQRADAHRRVCWDLGSAW